MPRISEFYGITIYMYHDDHWPAHFHAIYAGQDVEVLIDDRWTIVGRKFPVRASRFVREWAAEHRPELEVNWVLARQMQPLNQIERLA